jgi:hypothetical protein
VPVTFVIEETLSAIMTAAFAVSAVAAVATAVLMAAAPRYDKGNQPILISKDELMGLYLLFAIERTTAACSVLLSTTYLVHLLNTCTKVALAGALVASVFVMLKRLRVVRGKDDC